MAKKQNKGFNGPFNDLIRAHMVKHGWKKLEEFADNYKLGRTTVYALALGRQSANGTWVKPSVDTLVALAKALNLPAHDLLYLLEPDAMPEIINIPPGRTSIPLAGRVGAGPGQNHKLDDQIIVTAKFAAGRDLVAYTVTGDSMCAGKRPICDGDTIIIDRADKGQSGQIVVARLNDGSHVCKALKDDKFGKRLVSTNPMFTNSSPPILPFDIVDEVIGRVVRVIGDVKDGDAA